MIRLSAAIITLNEERNIGRCLESLSGIADEIVVVDSGSTDETKNLCLKYGATFIVNTFEGYEAQKNFAAGMCTHDYVLLLDADEALSPELKNEILSLKNNWIKDGYSFNRLTNYCGKWIRHCGWYPDRKLRLYKKEKGKWTGSTLHEKLVLDDESNQKVLNGDLLHFSYYTIEEHLKQVNKFTDLAAKGAFLKGERFSLVRLIFKPVIRFIRDYFFHLGVLDGFYGFVICCISSHASFIKYVKLYELQKKKG